ncbi:hypothetical protein LTS10_011416 [Elasticomyces elasticus]|nr:hypothetical protein LTS10_011416 [Elasticomyces elasticus]
MATLPKHIDSHWIWIYDGKEWPVVLCGDELAPKLFLETRRHPNEVAAIRLGRRAFTWVLEDRLQEYVPHENYLKDVQPFERDELVEGEDEKVKMEKQRRVAFRQDAPMLEPARYWQNVIEQQRLAKLTEKPTRKKKRKHTGDGSSQSSFSSTKQQRSSHSGRQLLTPDSTPRKQHHNYIGGEQRNRSIGLVKREEEEDDDESLFIADKDAAKHERENDLDAFRQQHEHELSSIPPKHGIYTILVGGDKTPFQFPEDAIRESELFCGRTKFTEKTGSVVDISDIEEVTAIDFVEVNEYLRYGDFPPPLIEKRNSLPRIDGLILPEEKDAAAEKCARVFRTASYLELGSLQALCLNKLRVLYPLSPLRILIVAKYLLRSVAWGCEAETEYVDWMIDHISEYYLLLVKQHGPQLVDILENSPLIKGRVMANLSANPEMGRRGLDD